MPDLGVPREDDANADATEVPAEEAGVDESTAADEPEEFQNRAARRAAKGKGSTQQQGQGQGKAKQLGARGPAQGPRQWANRRSG